MRRFLYPLTIAILCIYVSCRRTGLKKYYTKISSEEFASYDSVTIQKKSKHGIIYHVYQNTDRNIKIDFLVYKKVENGDEKGLFKLDDFTLIKNDSTFLFCDAPLKVVGDTSIWTKGIWFYTYKSGESTNYNIDSMPTNVQRINPQTITIGIYHVENGKLVKLSNGQSEQDFEKLDRQGFFYLPNPGCFFVTAKVDQLN